MGYTIEERAIAAAAATHPEVVFRTEVMCQFGTWPGLGSFPAKSWATHSIAWRIAALAA